MKLKSVENQEIVIGAKAQQSFSIDGDSPVIFDILRNKMYSNKIGAICREVSSNARDANREAGLGDQPIEIEFTKANNIYNIGDTCIVFRDFGVGINPDRMSNVFLKYAASTKRHSNAQTGGFGLGAKTPFAYTDSFIIKTVCIVEGEKKLFVYNAIIDSTGKGKMIQLDEKPTDKKTGTEIVVPILTSQDRSQFEHECYRATIYWKHVNYIGFTSKPSEIEYVFQEDSFSIVKAHSIFNSKYIGMLDGIPYPVEPSKYFNGLGDDYHILLDLDIEKVTINANRESIQNTDDTITYLDEKVEQIEGYLSDKIDEFLVQHTDFKEALAKHAKIKYSGWNYGEEFTELEKIINSYHKGYSNNNRLMSNKPFKIQYDGEIINGKLGLNHHRILVVTNTHLEEEDGKIINCKFDYKPIDTLNKKHLEGDFIYLDKGRHNTSKQLHLLKDNSFFILIKPEKGKTKELLKEDLQRLGDIGFEYRNYSEIVAPKKKVQYEKRDVNLVNLTVRSGASTSYSMHLEYMKDTKKLTNYKGDIDSSKVCFYLVDTLRDAERYRWSNEESIGDLLIALGKVQKVYIINKNMFNKHLKPDGFKTVREVFNRCNTAYLNRLKDYSELKTIFYRVIPEFLVVNFSELLPKSTQSLLDQKKKLEKSKVVDKINHIRWNRVGVTGSKFNYQGFKEKFDSNMRLKYPMLLPYLKSLPRSYAQVVNNDYTRTINHIKNYLKTI